MLNSIHHTIYSNPLSIISFADIFSIWYIVSFCFVSSFLCCTKAKDFKFNQEEGRNFNWRKGYLKRKRGMQEGRKRNGYCLSPIV